MERLSKSVVVCSIAVAVLANACVTPAGQGSLSTAASAALAIAYALARWRPRIACAVVLTFTYALPTIALVTTGAPHPLFSSLWSAALLGIVLAGRAPLRWHAPAPWRLILIAWALPIAITWPIVALREIDFTWTLLHRFSPASTGRGLWPDFVVGAITHDAATIGVGVLWFDWLFATYHDKPRAFSRSILAPLAAGAAAAIVVGIVQDFVDVRFLNDQPWLRLRRAPGTLADANAFGMVAALWAPAFIALARPRGRGIVAAIGGLAAASSCIALSASGSRTAVLAGAIGLAGAAFYYRTDLLSIRRRHVVVAGSLAAVAMFTFAAWLPRQTVGPVARTLQLGNSISFDSPGRVAFDLWDRDLYGTVATMMIRQHPLVGVGTGSFAFLSTDYTTALGRPSPIDNAQNWFRHQLAELGLLGSVGWIAWTFAFGAALWRGRRARATTLDGGSLAGAMLGFGLASLVGGPGLHPAVALTFLTFAFWFLAFDAPAPVARQLRARRKRIAIAGLCVVALHAGGTAVVARSDLRVPVRASRFGWPYSYGLYDPEAYPFRWTQDHAVVTFPAVGRTLRVAFHISHPDAATHPVGVRIEVNGEPIFDEELHDSAIIVRDVALHNSEPYVLLETHTSRTWRPRDYQQSDDRRLGVAIRWEFGAVPSAEMIPHYRPAAWDQLDLKTPTANPVRVTGHLFYDDAHTACKNGKGSPARRTVWEIHPVYQLDVCTGATAAACDASVPSAWTPYDQWVTQPGSVTTATGTKQRSLCEAATNP